MVIPGTGVVMNNEMDDFSIQAGVRNYFGLIGAQANAIAPGKRPLSSMSPTLVLKGGQPIRVQVGLARRGHKLKRLLSMGVSQIVARSPDSKGFVGAADLRAGGNAAGW